MIPNSKTRIMVFGTFDVLHKGHLNFFKQARKLAKKPYLIVSVARDENVKRIKGRKPKFSERRRLRAVKKWLIVDKAILGGLKKHIPHIFNQKPDILALGYDQKEYVKSLKADLKRAGLKVKIVRLKAFKPHLYKSSLVKNNLVL